MPDFKEFEDLFGARPKQVKKSAAQPEWHPVSAREERAAKAPPKPDAIVLCIIHTRCTTCGVIHDYPSAHLLCRYGPRDGKLAYVWTSAAADSYPSDMPFEVIHHETTNAHCATCFAPFVTASLRRRNSPPSHSSPLPPVSDGDRSAPSPEQPNPPDAICEPNYREHFN